MHQIMLSGIVCASDQLEWSMKLWWPHCEALVAFLMAYNQTKEPELLERFSQVYEYTFSHVSLPPLCHRPTANFSLPFGKYTYSLSLCK